MGGACCGGRAEFVPDGLQRHENLAENEQLKAQVTELQKQNGQMGNDLETMTAARDALAKENAALKTKRSRRNQSAPQRKLSRRHR